MALTHPPSDPAFQPSFIAETAWQMKDGGLDYSCYYHIRYYHVLHEVFGRFMSPHGNAEMSTRPLARRTGGLLCAGGRFNDCGQLEM
jgi:hypothetical protein